MVYGFQSSISSLHSPAHLNFLLHDAKLLVMAHPWHHAISSAKQHGGKPEDYLKIHDWFDQTKAHMPDVRHRAILHSSFGIFLCEQVFGSTLVNSSGKHVPVRLIGEQHVMEDMGGKIPTAQDWLEEMSLRPWMTMGARRLSEESDEG
jgi:hypothetical protein